MEQAKDTKTIVVFLDIDGVLACTGYLLGVPEAGRSQMFNALSPAREHLNPVGFGLLNALFAEHGELRLVCSSVWRKAGRAVVDEALREAHAALERASQTSIPFALRWHDVDGQPESWRTAPTWEADHPRGDGVRDYLEHYGMPQDQDLILIDDESDFHADQMPFLIRTDGHSGFTMRDYIATQNLIGAMKTPAPPAPEAQRSP